MEKGIAEKSMKTDGFVFFGSGGPETVNIGRRHWPPSLAVNIGRETFSSSSVVCRREKEVLSRLDFRRKLNESKDGFNSEWRR